MPADPNMYLNNYGAPAKPSNRNSIISVASSAQSFGAPPPGIPQDDEYPSPAELEAEIQRILSSADLSTITKKQIRKELTAYFGMDLSHRKQFIHQCIENCLAQMM
jgi:chitin synthase